MKIWTNAKNLMLTLTLTMLYAIWSKEGLHEVSKLHMWAILILVALLIFHLLTVIDREVRRIAKERILKSYKHKKMKGENEYEKTIKSSKRT